MQHKKMKTKEFNIATWNIRPICHGRFKKAENKKLEGNR